MRILILAGVAAAALTLTACNREEPAEATTDGPMTADTGSMSADTSGGAMSSGSATGSGSTSSSSGRAAPSGGSAAAGSTSAESMPAVPPAEAPTTEATRAGAKERAESTNLHPSAQ
jgi:hypothetical protein